jgi:dTDP-4-dehydrorhamnose 3,5-epimerase
MLVTPTEIPDVLEIAPKVFGDQRGFFFESYNHLVFRDKTGLDVTFVQDNHSCSAKNVLRGLHYQIHHPQGKLVRVIKGSIYDVVVDIRRSSPTFGQWVSRLLTAEEKNQLWVPPGFAHGFLVLSDQAEVLYKATDYYAPEYDRCIRWNDPDIGIHWPLEAEPTLSAKDAVGKFLQEAEVYS